MDTASPASHLHGGAPPPAPPGWTAQWDDRYKAWFWVNTTTHQSQWEYPAASSFASPQQQSQPPQGVDGDAALAARLQAEEDGRARNHSLMPPSQHGSGAPPYGSRPGSQNSGYFQQSSPSPYGQQQQQQPQYHQQQYSPQPQYHQGGQQQNYGQYPPPNAGYGAPAQGHHSSEKSGSLLGKILGKAKNRLSGPPGAAAAHHGSGKPPKKNKWGLPAAAAGGVGVGALGGAALGAMKHKFSGGHGGGHGFGGGHGYHGGGPGYYGGGGYGGGGDEFHEGDGSSISSSDPGGSDYSGGGGDDYGGGDDGGGFDGGDFGGE